jgi:hypothetical protein
LRGPPTTLEVAPAQLLPTGAAILVAEPLQYPVPREVAQVAEGRLRHTVLEVGGPASELAEYDRRHRELAAQIAEIGIIAAGSVTRRYTRCTSAGCRCNADPPAPHRPYWQWTAKVNGKTVTRRLTAREARLYQEWIANDRRIRALLDQMRTVDAKAAELLLKEDAGG